MLMKLTAMRVALVAVFAALQAVLATFPFTIAIGVTGYSITLGLIGGPLIGILLGPFMGGTAVLIGSLVGVFVNPSGAIIGLLTVIPPSCGALAAGFVKLKKAYFAGLIILFSLLVFYAHPFGKEAFLFPWLHIVAMVTAFSPVAYIAGSGFADAKHSRVVFGIVIASFVGVLTDHIVGSAIAIWYFSPGLIPQIWHSIMFVYPIERAIALTVASAVAVPVYYGLKKAGLADLLK
jgi:hypothetical protein